MGREFYTAADVASAETVESLIRERLSLWRSVGQRPGAVVLFEIFGRTAHIGLVLTAREFVHSFGGTETAILRLDDPSWSRRVRGFYDTGV